MHHVQKQPVSPEQIIGFLEDHPDFFNRNPEILRHLVIPHQVDGNVTSFIEHQLISLRNRICEMTGDYENLAKLQESEIKLAKTVHDLLPVLWSCTSPGQLHEILAAWLQDHYSADRVLLIVFGCPDLTCHDSDLIYAGKNTKLEFMFTEIFHRNRPLCSSLQDEHLDALFGKKTEQLKSTVILPFSNHGRRVLLVLGSYKSGRYAAGFRLELLVFVNHIINLKLEHLLAVNNSPRGSKR